jgi:hypothetical protein
MAEGVKSSDQEAVCRAKTQPRFKPKNGSVIPAKRRLVKTMMFDYIVQSISCLLCSCGSSSSGAPKALSKNYSGCSEMVPPPNSSNGRIRKKNNIFPAYTS